MFSCWERPNADSPYARPYDIALILRRISASTADSADAEDLGGDRGVQVLAGGERLDQALVLGEVGHHAQLDLAVVGGHQRLEALADDEAAADRPALVGADRDVLQVRVGRGQPAGRGHRLVEGGVDTAVRRRSS